MTSSDFQKVLIKDDRIGNVTDAIKYAVCKGGQSVTPAQFNAISASASNHSFNIQCPSQETILDRKVIWRCTTSIKVTIALAGTFTTALPTVGQVLGYGCNNVNFPSSSLGAFPLHQLCSTMTSTINNTNVTINIRDVLPFILRFNDKRTLSRYNGTTPTAFDVYQKYSDAVGSINNPLGSFSNSADNDLVQRGAFAVDITAYDNTTGSVGPVALDAEAQPGHNYTFTITFTSAEPLLLSPWMFANPAYNNQGMYGIQNLNFVFNIGDCSRVFRTSVKQYPSLASVIPNNEYGQIGPAVLTNDPFQNSQLLFTFLTPHPSDMMPARNVVPYYELPRFISTNIGAIASGFPATVTTQTLQLNQIPDKLIVAVRKQMGQQKNNDADCFLPINSVSIQFNNQAGILSSATQQDLYQMSVKSGSNQSWYEFCGKANTSASNTASAIVKTSGSILCLEFGRDIQLPEDWYASGSLGNFNLQVQLNVLNNTEDNIDNTNPYEIVLITMNSGVFVCERGTSQVYTGILTKQDVIDASSKIGRAHV